MSHWTVQAEKGQVAAERVSALIREARPIGATGSDAKRRLFERNDSVARLYLGAALWLNLRGPAR